VKFRTISAPDASEQAQIIFEGKLRKLDDGRYVMHTKINDKHIESAPSRNESAASSDLQQRVEEMTLRGELTGMYR
jgi:hypothetical protein